ncbi:MAG: formylmethanofuran dehydrogenase subunit [Candidatus Methanomethylophilaceae archaeon]|nr:formylmethanofuran dehydrogenase subunit [Candidatus Methanomethylophilaceae archaeon]MDI3542254.1 formylmethanofuran dehydrogenase subunit [Candidatus Methanomethylophilaceae archaeon]HIJ00394.1 hypothetical protein [Candidatus Methanomethylophilaceae archaeon]
MTVLTEEMERLKDFHTHLGPYVVIGYRMGLIAKEKIGKPRRCEVYCGKKPPISCLIDGIQFSSGCTMGKGNIIIAGEGESRARFYKTDNEFLEIKLIPDLKRRIDKEMGIRDEEEASMEIALMNPEQMFHITRHP